MRGVAAIRVGVSANLLYGFGPLNLSTRASIVTLSCEHLVRSARNEGREQERALLPATVHDPTSGKPQHFYAPRGDERKRAMLIRRTVMCSVLLGIVMTAFAAGTLKQPVVHAVDPGLRGGAPSAGGALPGLTADETTFLQDGLKRFLDIESVTGRA